MKPEPICIPCHGTKKILSSIGNIFIDCPICSVPGKIESVAVKAESVMTPADSVIEPIVIPPQVRDKRIPKKAKRNPRSLQRKIAKRLQSSGIVLPVDSSENKLV